MSRSPTTTGSAGPGSSAAIGSRRTFLAVLAALPLVPAVAMAWMNHAGKPVSPDQPIARLGACLAATNPALARALARDVEAWMDHNCPDATVSERAAAARRALLDPVRLAGEYERREIVRVDGWILSRTEASVCAYLYAASGRSVHPI